MESYDTPPSNSGLSFKIFVSVLLFVIIVYLYFKIISPTNFTISPITTTPVPTFNTTTTAPPTTAPPTTAPPTTTPVPLPSIPNNYVLIPDGTYNSLKMFQSGNTTFQLDTSGDLTMRYKGDPIWISGTREGGTHYTVLNGVVTLINGNNTNLWSSSTLLNDNVSLSPTKTYTTYLIDAAKLGIVDTSTNTIFATYLDGLSVVAVPNNSFECDGVKNKNIQLGYCQFSMQVDGNFVIYVTSDDTKDPTALSGNGPRYIWGSGSSGIKCKLEYKQGALYIESQGGDNQGQRLYIIEKPSTPPAIDPQLYFKNTGQIVTIDGNGIVNILVDKSREYFSRLKDFT